MSAKLFSGPPPSVGWWPMPDGRVRWWNGDWWSVAISQKDGFIIQSASVLNHWAALQTQSRHVVWQRRPKSWPARSRT